MPTTTRSKATESPRAMLQDAAEERASLKQELSLHRQALLSILDQHKVDTIPLSGTRVIRRTTITSSKRITQKLLLAFLEGYYTEIISPLGKTPDQDMLHGHLKQAFLASIDTSTHKGEVLPSESAAAQRKCRDGTPLRVGGTSLITPEVLALAESFETLQQRLSELNTQATNRRKRRRRDDASDSPVDNETPVANSSAGNRALGASPPSRELSTDPAAGDPGAPPAAAATTPATGPAATPPEQGRKPMKKTVYINKSVAYSVLEQVARLLVENFIPHAPWGSVEAAIANIVEAVF